MNSPLISLAQYYAWKRKYKCIVLKGKVITVSYDITCTIFATYDSLCKRQLVIETFKTNLNLFHVVLIKKKERTKIQNKCQPHELCHEHLKDCNCNRPILTLTLPGPSAGVSRSLDSYCSLKPLCSGMGEVVPARTSPTLLPPSPRTVLSLSCFKVLQCINCHD